MFQKEIELIKKIREDFAKRKQKEIEDVLMKHPYDDKR
jgi:hypothetical protein